MNIVIWVVYKNPSDFPGLYVAREFIGCNGSSEYFSHLIVGEVRHWIRSRAKLYAQGEPERLPPYSQDDPVIFETWI